MWEGSERTQTFFQTKGNLVEAFVPPIKLFIKLYI